MTHTTDLLPWHTFAYFNIQPSISAWGFYQLAIVKLGLCQANAFCTIAAPHLLAETVLAYIQHKKSVLIIRAGHKAMAHIRQHGLQPQDIDIIPGAAGGPKGIGLCGLDQAIFADFLLRAPAQTADKRTCFGASIGSWRFAAIAAHGGQEGPKRLAELYTSMQFSKKDKVADVTRRCHDMLQHLIDDKMQNLINHAWMQLVIVVVKSRHIFASDHVIALGLALAGVAGSNLLSRRANRLFMQRGFAYAHPAHNPLPLNDSQEFFTHHLPLDASNAMHLLMASAAIPAVISAVSDIPLVPKGSYRDGGLLDYHLDLPYQSKGLVLYPHFSDRIIPGWFDKSLRWRKANAQNQQRTVLIAPSPEYLATLPLGRLPDRRDFVQFAGNDTERQKCWQRSVAESQRLGDAFLELVEKQSFAANLALL